MAATDSAQREKPHHDAELNAYVTRRIPLQKAEQEAAEKSLEAATDATKAELTAVRQREQAQDEAKLAAAERAGQPWPPLIPRSERSLTTMPS